MVLYTHGILTALFPYRERNEDGKSLKNPQHGVLSKAYEEFPDPLCKDRRGGFDIHIYHFQVLLLNFVDVQLSQERNSLWSNANSNDRIIPNKPPLPKPSGNEYGANVSLVSPSRWSNLKNTLADATSLVPELRIYAFFDRPVGPHPVAMFEVNIFTPAQFGAFVPWLVINRGPLSALIHPNTTPGAAEELRNHTQQATWLGERIPLDLTLFNKMKEKEKEALGQS